MENTRKDLKKRQIISFVLTIAIIVILNVIGNFVFKRFDLTAEKRYTLSDTSKEILKNIDDYVYFKVYLEGDFPAGFKKLRRETKEMLDEFRAYSKFIDYEFINPNIEGDDKDRIDMYHQLQQGGLYPYTRPFRNNDGSMSQMVIWPGALVSYHNDTELAINLLDEKDIDSQMEIEDLTSVAMRNLEFKLINGIKRITSKQKPTVAFIEGHGELSELEVYDITRELSKNYIVKRVAIDGKVDALMHRTEPDKNGNIKAFTSYDAIVIAKPTQPFNDKDKFLIDQYIMHGGKVLWLVEPVFATMDSLRSQESTMGIDLALNLDDMLFKYGVRMNHNLLLDLNCAAVPVKAGQVAGQPQFEYYRWYYFPLLQAASNNPIVRNIDLVKADFVSSLEATSSAVGIEQIPLLKTSDYTKESGVPAYITLAMLRQPPDKRMFSQRGQNTAYLLKGTFPSLYANRLTADIVESKEMQFREESDPTAMIVVADGDIIRNQTRNNTPLPLGYDQYTGNIYGNKEFVLNAISYLIDGEGFVNIRSRELKIRLLDQTKTNQSRLKWQLINVIIPIALIMLLGTTLALIRKHRYTKKK